MNHVTPIIVLNKIISLYLLRNYNFFFHGPTAPSGSRPPHCRGFMITVRHSTLGRTPLDKWSARRRDLYLTIHNPHKRQTSMPPAGFAPAIPASGRPQTHALDRAATGSCYFIWLWACRIKRKEVNSILVLSIDVKYTYYIRGSGESWSGGQV